MDLHELDAQRMEAAQLAVLGSKPGTWAHTHWSNVLEALKREWNRKVAESCYDYS
jgi:hypothetical protein